MSNTNLFSVFGNEFVQELNMAGHLIEVGGSVYVQVLGAEINKSIFVGSLVTLTGDVLFKKENTVRIIPAIKFVRTITGWGLKDAKAYVEEIISAKEAGIIKET